MGESWGKKKIWLGEDENARGSKESSVAKAYANAGHMRKATLEERDLGGKYWSSW